MDFLEIWNYARTILGYAFIALAIVFMIIGTIGIFRFRDEKSFYIRILVATKVDTVGVITGIIGFCLIHGLSFFTGKLVLIAIVAIVLNPLVSHIMVRSAYDSGYEIMERDARPEEAQGENGEVSVSETTEE